MPSRVDEWPDEPDEPDPEARWGSPEEDLVSVPSVDTGDPGAAGAGIEVDGEISKFFWAAVVYANAALGGVAVGVLLVVFRGRLTVGAVAIAVGLLALYRTYDVYRRYQEYVDGSEGGDRTERGDAAAGADGDGDGPG